MTDTDLIRKLKSAARKLARTADLNHVSALNTVAASIGYAHWKSVLQAAKRGWLPTQDNLATAYALSGSAAPLADTGFATRELDVSEPSFGEVQGHAYRVTDVLDDVYVFGRSWEFKLPEAPLALPKFRVTDRRFKNNPINEPVFRAALLAIAERFRKRVHARIASDWPSRATVPDAAGLAEHPLGHGVSDTWWCMHCDHRSTSLQITANLFHCPNCLATPMDIHTSPWWLEQERRAV